MLNKPKSSIDNEVTKEYRSSIHDEYHRTVWSSSMTAKNETTKMATTVVQIAAIVAMVVMLSLVLIVLIYQNITSSRVIIYQETAKVPYSFIVGTCGRFNIKCTELSLGDLPCYIPENDLTDFVGIPFGTITETVQVRRDSTSATYDQKELHKILGEICVQAHRGTLAEYISTGANEYKKYNKE